MILAGAVLPATISASELRPAEERSPAAEPRLGVFAGLGYLGSPGAHGAAMTAGLRLALGSHLAASFDLGYGLLHDGTIVEDRWWLIPSLAWVTRAGWARLDFGAGLGLGASSGYASAASYVAAPFSPVWAFQLVPAARAHALAAVGLGRDVDLFARVEVASLWLDSGSIGFRAGKPDGGAKDSTWVGLTFGAQLRVL